MSLQIIDGAVAVQARTNVAKGVAELVAGGVTAPGVATVLIALLHLATPPQLDSEALIDHVPANEDVDVMLLTNTGDGANLQQSSAD